jgi:hypothetical protein
MITYYNKKDLVSFGNYLLSEARKETIWPDHETTQVYHADIENWKETLK